MYLVQLLPLKMKFLLLIPITQRAPSFATRYKFCIKPDKDTYETIYSSIFFEDDNSNNVFFLLEGDNIGKVKDGDRLIVKRDIAGLCKLARKQRH